MDSIVKRNGRAGASELDLGALDALHALVDETVASLRVEDYDRREGAEDALESGRKALARRMADGSKLELGMVELILTRVTRQCQRSGGGQ